MTAVPPTGDLNARVSVYRDGVLIGTRRQIDFISDGDSGDDADSASPDRVSVGVGGGSGLGAPAGTTVGSIAAGATTFTLVGAAPGTQMLPNNGAIIAVGTGTSFEARRLTSIVGNVVTVNYQFMKAHSSGASVWLIPSQTVTPQMYGAALNLGVTDDWSPYQRMLFDMYYCGVDVDGWGFRGYCGHPIGLPPTGHPGGTHKRLYLLTNVSGGWAGPNQDEGGAWMCCKYLTTFSASGSNTLLLADTVAGLQLSAGSRIFFNDPHNGNLPTGITSGQVYWVKTASGSSITLSATNGGATLTIGATGAGVGYALPYTSLSKQNWNTFRGEVNDVNLHGLVICCQQVSEVRDVYVLNMGGKSGGGTFFPLCINIGPAQGLRADDWNTRSVVNSQSILMTGASLLSFGGWTYIGHEDPALSGVVFSSCFGIKMDIWTESHGTVEIQGGPCRNIEIGTFYGSFSNTEPCILDSSSDDSSWSVGSFEAASGDNLLAKDSGGSWALYSWNGIGYGQGITDIHQVAVGIVKLAGRSPRLAERFTVQRSDDIFARLIDEFIQMDVTGTTRTITFAANVLFGDNEWRVQRVAGANHVVVSPASGAMVTINDGLVHVFKVQSGSLNEITYA